ncbi:MAG: DUF4153 domain-containing protein [Bacteroidia bacterium]
MKLISAISEVLRTAGQAILRFPGVFACSASASILAVYLAHYNDVIEPWYRDMVGHLIMVAGLGISLFFSAHLKTEQETRWVYRIAPFIAAQVLMAICFLDIRIHYVVDNDEAVALRYFGYLLGAHLITSFFPVRNKSNSHALWQYNRVLFLRSFTTALYSAVLFGGLAGAILALDILFNLKLDEKIYADLWFCLAGFGSSLIFASGIPKDIVRMDEDSELPKGLAVFAAYILLPLVVIYGLILYAYEGKIIFHWSLPEGWVSNLIMAFSVVGMLALLLLHPYGQNSDKPWINRFTRNYYFALYPLLILLFVAAWIRIDAYGFTVLRYSLLALAIWLTFIAVYMPLSGNKRIVMVPASLLALLLMTWFIPGANAWSISKLSQQNRLLHNLVELKLWNPKNQTWLLPETALSDSTSTAIWDQFEYLLEKHGPAAVRPFVQIPDSAMNRLSDGKRRRLYSRYEAESFLENALKPYGIVPYTYISEANMEDAIEPASEESFELRAVSNTRAMLNIPAGNWTLTTPVQFGHALYLNSVRLELDSSHSNLTITNGPHVTSFPLTSMAAKRIAALRNQPYSNNRFNLGDQMLVLEDEHSRLEISDLNFTWQPQPKAWKVEHVIGQLWLKD